VGNTRGNTRGNTECKTEGKTEGKTEDVELIPGEPGAFPLSDQGVPGHRHLVRQRRDHSFDAVHHAIPEV
jgi:hypothetical protein